MPYTLEEKYKLIKEEVLKHKEVNPIVIINDVMKNNYINTHGTEHHFLDETLFLVAYNNVSNSTSSDISYYHFKFLNRFLLIL